MAENHITEVSGTGVPIRGNDIDTDQILPARFMKEVTFDNMADYLFYDARRDDDGTLNDHPLNVYEGANVAVVNKNFGCGSSREHAPQAMMRWGVDGVVGESFAEIFRDNCKSLGIPAATADRETVTDLQDWIEANPDGEIEIDVEAETVTYGGRTVDVEIDDAMKEALVEGIWDTTALMYSNLSKVEETAAQLAYVEGAD
ncbi:3-isopropylmalate dehydratase small subunit [Halobacteriales archaeon QS_1_68_17]|nr:MAG: 3-isopropylmalate dehydratase small subunit [Halobacteriales archaeon QS_1_68_17]